MHGWIWPKDPLPSTPSHWPRRRRHLDVFLNKGPDIFVGRIGAGSAMKKGEWSRWPRTSSTCDVDADVAFPWARRGSEKRYDFRTRRYGVPNEGSWSGVEYCSCRQRELEQRVHVIPRRFGDACGRCYPAGEWHDLVYGTGCGCSAKGTCK